MKSDMWIAGTVAFSFILGMALESARASRGDKDALRVTGVGGIFFKAQNPGKLGEWYREHLGIELEKAGPGDDAPQYHPFQWRQKDHPEKAGSTVLSMFLRTHEIFRAEPLLLHDQFPRRESRSVIGAAPTGGREGG